MDLSCQQTQWLLVEVTVCPAFPKEHVFVTVKVFLSLSEESLFVELFGGALGPAASPGGKQEAKF